MFLVRRSAKPLLLIKAYGIPLHQTFCHRDPLDWEPAQEQIIKRFSRIYSVLADNHMHENLLKDEQEERPLIDGYQDSFLSGRTCTALSEERCKGEGLELGDVELAGGASASKIEKRNDGSTSEPAIVYPFESSFKVDGNERHCGSSSASETPQTTEFLSKGKQVHIVGDSTLSIIVRDIKALSEDYTAELVKKKEKVLIPETGLQTEDVAMASFNDASGTQESFCNSTKKQTHTNVSTASEKVESFRNEQELASRCCEIEYSDVQKERKEIKKKKKKEKMKSSNTDIHIRPKDFDHLRLSPHPLSADTGGQTLCEEKPKNHGDYINNDHVHGYLESMASDALKSSKSAKRNRKTLMRLLEKNPSSPKDDTDIPLPPARQHAQLNDLSCDGVYDNALLQNFDGKSRSVDPKMKSQIFKGYDGESRASTGMISYNHFKDGTSLDPPPDFWENDWARTPIEAVERDNRKSGLEGPKVHQSFPSSRELYVILDLNGVLIKRWDKNPSLTGVKKVNQKWIQLRPGCIEFLQKAFSSFRVGIWSTMTPANVQSTCKFIEEEARRKFPFFMLWSKESCYQKRGLHRPDKASVVADFKPLSRVWDYFAPYLGFHNTILIDDSPYKACMNNPHNCIFPDAFEGSTDDVYLNDVLWPYLEKVRMSHSIQAFVAMNPHGQPPVVVGHDLYSHVRRVMRVDERDYSARPLARVN